MSSQGTTPRRLTDLIGSLCDLTSGSGDKGTPIILIQGYFDNFAVYQKAPPIRGWGCFSVAGAVCPPGAHPGGMPLQQAANQLCGIRYVLGQRGFSRRPAMCPLHLATGMSTFVSRAFRHGAGPWPGCIRPACCLPSQG